MNWFEGAAVVGAICGVGSLVVAIATATLNARQGERMERLVASQMKIVASFERETKRRRTDAVGGLGSGADSLRREALELRKREAEWKRTKDLVKGLKWFAENVEL